MRQRGGQTLGTSRKQQQAPPHLVMGTRHPAMSAESLTTQECDPDSPSMRVEGGWRLLLAELEKWRWDVICDQKWKNLCLSPELRRREGYWFLATPGGYLPTQAKHPSLCPLLLQAVALSIS